MLSTRLPTGRLGYILALIFGIVLSAHPVSAAAPLRVSANGHYLERPNGKPFFFLSDTEWLLNDHPDTQVRAILNDRKRKGFTVIQVFGCRDWPREDSQSSQPFQDNSPLRFNKPYWDRWRWIADQAKQRGLLLLFIYGEPGRADTPWKVHGLAEAYAYGHLVGQTFHDKTNIIFCDGQDIDTTQGIGLDGTQVASDLRAIFQASDRTHAEVLLRQVVHKYERCAPKLSLWLEANLPEGLTVFSFPEGHRRLLMTSNGVERLSREVKRRTQVASIFPNEASCLRLVSAVLMEISDDWQACKSYLTFTEKPI